MNRRNFLGLVIVAPIVVNKDFTTKEEREDYEDQEEYYDDYEDDNYDHVSTGYEGPFHFRDLIPTRINEYRSFLRFENPIKNK